MMASLDGSSKEMIKEFSTSVRDVAIDWTLRRMFLSNFEKGLLQVMNMKTLTISTLLTCGKGTIDIALDMTKSLVYWSFAGSTPKIGVMAYNGSERNTLISNGILWPSGLTLDNTGDHLFWCDAHTSMKRIRYINLITRVVTIIKRGRRYFDVSYFEGRLYVIAREFRSSFYSIDVDGSNEETYNLSNRMSEWRMIKVFRYYTGRCQNGTRRSSYHRTCGNCQEGTICEEELGYCPKGCKPGWLGVKCHTECRTGRYGAECGNHCGHCRDESVCSKTTGACTRGCGTGWTGFDCKEECPEGQYGPGCLMTCGHCYNDQPCNKSTGKCISGCMAGWSGVECKKECEEGNYGQDCNSTCDQCKNGTACDKIHGVCLDGCEPGWMGVKCDSIVSVINQTDKTECPNGTYGPGCMSKCGWCRSSTICDKVLGVCLDGCELGWMGVKCDTECTDGHYGAGCLLTCGQCHADRLCQKNSGACIHGCEFGWTGTDCKRGSRIVRWILVAVCGLLGITVFALTVITIRIRRYPKCRDQPSIQLRNRQEGMESAAFGNQDYVNSSHIDSYRFSSECIYEMPQEI